VQRFRFAPYTQSKAFVSRRVAYVLQRHATPVCVVVVLRSAASSFCALCVEQRQATPFRFVDVLMLLRYVVQRRTVFFYVATDTLCDAI
jgi:hypothetical protein